MIEPEMTRIGTLELGEAKRIRSLLLEKGIQLELVSDPQTCSTGGCARTVDVFVASEKIPEVTDFLKAEKIRAVDGLEFDSVLINEVYDPEKESARCPACGTRFSTQLKECPDCGLGFGA